MAIYTRQTVVLAKLETAYGVDANPTENDYVEVFDVSISPNMETVNRNPYRSTFSPVASLPSKFSTELSFTVELKGSGLDDSGAIRYPAIGKLLEACGFTSHEVVDDSSSSVIGYKFTPISTDFPSITFYVYLGNILYKVLGARGSVQIQLEANQVPKLNFKFTGKFLIPQDVSKIPEIPEDVLKLFPTPHIVKCVNLTMDGYAPVLSAFEVDMNNDITIRDDLNSCTGVGEVLITGRKPQGSLNPDMFNASQYDVWTKFTHAQPVSIQGTVGRYKDGSYDKGNAVDVIIPHAVIDKIGIGDRDTVRIYDISFVATGNDDEVQLIFK